MKHYMIDEKRVKRIVNRKLRKNILRIDYMLDWLPFDKKVYIAFYKLHQIDFTSIRLYLYFWEPFEKLSKTFKKNNCDNWELVRNYKKGCLTPGLVEIYFDECINDKLIQTLIRKHYGYELGKVDSLSLDMIFVFEKDKDITICHLYDDRGFRFFHLDQNYMLPPTTIHKKP